MSAVQITMHLVAALAAALPDRDLMTDADIDRITELAHQAHAAIAAAGGDYAGTVVQAAAAYRAATEGESA